MAITVSLIIVNCGPPATLTIHGTGMIVSNMYITGDGNNVPYTIINESSTIINVQPSIFSNGRWCVGFVPQAASLCTQLICPVTDLSGVFFINGAKPLKRDTYYFTEVKIPDPMIRTALIGE